MDRVLWYGRMISWVPSHYALWDYHKVECTARNHAVSTKIRM